MTDPLVIRKMWVLFFQSYNSLWGKVGGELEEHLSQEQGARLEAVWAQ